MSERSPVPSGPSVLDDLARLAARVADAPLAFVTLIDGTLQRFAASVFMPTSRVRGYQSEKRSSFQGSAALW